MVKNPKVTLAPHYKIWLCVIIINFAIAVFSLGMLLVNTYYSTYEEFVMVGLLFVLTISLAYGISKPDEKIITYAAIVEFILLLLPLLSFDAWAGYLPYYLPGLMVVLFPILWVILPIGVMHQISSKKAKKRFMTALVAIIFLIGASWLAISQMAPYEAAEAYYDGVAVINYEHLVGADWTMFLVFFLLLLASLAMWLFEYQHITGGRDYNVAPGKLNRMRYYIPELLLTVIVLFLFFLGFIVPAMYTPMCGDMLCDASEDAFSCAYDCGYCGDGFCDDLLEEDNLTCADDCMYGYVVSY